MGESFLFFVSSPFFAFLPPCSFSLLGNSVKHSVCTFTTQTFFYSEKFFQNFQATVRIASFVNVGSTGCSTNGHVLCLFYCTNFKITIGKKSKTNEVKLYPLFVAYINTSPSKSCIINMYLCELNSKNYLLLET